MGFEQRGCGSGGGEFFFQFIDALAEVVDFDQGDERADEVSQS
jgi:hypothetical protein